MSLVAATLVGVGLAGASTLVGPASVAHADPPPADPPTSITLATNESQFAAGSSATLTATTDQDVSDTASTITITDETTSSTVATCTTGTTCTASVSFDTGDAHTCVANVNDLTSNEVTVGREAWTVSLSSSSMSFSAGDSFTLTATANQDVGSTGSNYFIRIFDQTTETLLQSCNSGSSCAVSSQFASGAPHSYVAEVSAGGAYPSYGATTDVQGTSNVVTVSRAAWSVSLTSDETEFDAGDSATLTATANQDVGSTGGDYYIRIYDANGGLVTFWYK